VFDAFDVYTRQIGSGGAEDSIIREKRKAAVAAIGISRRLRFSLTHDTGCACGVRGAGSLQPVR
jgi:hypothetical protein